MNARRFLPILLIFFLAAACAEIGHTSVVYRPAAVRSLRYGDIDVTSPITAVTLAVADDLKTAVAGRLSKLPQGSTPVKVHLAITQFNIHSREERFLLGKIAGSNEITVAVRIDDEQGKPVAEFEVVRSVNPGGSGAFYDQTSAMIDLVVDGVAEALSKAKRREPD